MTGSGRNTRPGAIISKASNNLIDIRRLGFFQSFFFSHTHEVIQKLRRHRSYQVPSHENFVVYIVTRSSYK